MSNPPKLRCGIIGAGDFGAICHLPGLQSHPQAEVVALCRRSYDPARSLADKFGVPDVHKDYLELCARNDLDAVTVATPTVVHAEQSIAALRSGKHVFCEKPLAMNLLEAREMVRVAEDSGKVHQVGFTFRYNFGVQELRRRVRAGDIGLPYYVRVQYDGWEGLRASFRSGWQDKLDTAGGGVLYNLGSHLFDIVRYLFGPIERVTGFLHNLPRQARHRQTGELVRVETDDLAAVWFRHENGLRGEWFISRITPPFARKGFLEVIGPEGALKAGLSRGSVDRLRVSRPTSQRWIDLPLPVQASDGQPHCLGTMMRSFVDACMRGRLDSDIDASFQDGLAAQQAMAAVIEADRNLTWVKPSEAG